MKGFMSKMFLNLGNRRPAHPIFDYFYKQFKDSLPLRLAGYVGGHKVVKMVLEEAPLADKCHNSQRWE